MARSTGSIHIADNSVTAINDALQQLLFLIDELRGEHSSTRILVGPHTHHGGTTGTSTTSQDGGPITPQTLDHDDLINVTTDQHHAKLHETSHRSGGLDALKLDDLAAPDDNTDLNASTASHGLLPKLSGNNATYLDGSGSFTTPAGGTGGSDPDTSFVEAQLLTPPFDDIVIGRTLGVEYVADGNAIAMRVGDVDSFKPAFARSSSANLTAGNFTVGSTIRFHRRVKCRAMTIWWPGGVGSKTVKLAIWQYAGSLVDSVNITCDAAGLYTGFFPNEPILNGAPGSGFGGVAHDFSAYVTDGSYYLRDDGCPIQYDQNGGNSLFYGMYSVAYAKSYAAGDARNDNNDTFYHQIQLDYLEFYEGM